MSTMMKSIRTVGSPSDLKRTAAIRFALALQSTCSRLRRADRPITAYLQRRHHGRRCLTSSANTRSLSSTHVPIETDARLNKTPRASSSGLPPIPDYLRQEYWWAYGHPQCIRALDHEVLVNLVLWGNFRMLRDECIQEVCGNGLTTLQVACVYANFSQMLVKHLAATAGGGGNRGSRLHVVDVIPAQLENLKQKLSSSTDDRDVTLCCNDAQALQYEDNYFDQVVLFFLLHELPDDVRIRTLAEATRVLKPGGKAVLLDYHRPNSWTWQRLMGIMFRLYEPFAMDLWEHEIQEWLPNRGENLCVSKRVYSDGLYQKVVVTKKK